MDCRGLSMLMPSRNSHCVRELLNVLVPSEKENSWGAPAAIQREGLS